MRVKTAYYTNRGKLRGNNEDSLLIYDELFSSEDFHSVQFRSFDIKQGFFSVADGMGGLEGGEIASCTVLSYLKEQSINDKDDIKPNFYGALKKLDKVIEKNPKLSEMGTVITGIYLKDHSGIIFNTGDSRTYFMRESLKRMTEDNSLVWELQKKDKFSEEEERHEWVRSHPGKNIVTSALINGGETFECQVEEITLKTGDKFFICSDGVWEELRFSQMEEAMAKPTEEGAEEILRLCWEEAKDNLSFIIVEILSV